MYVSKKKKKETASRLVTTLSSFFFQLTTTLKLTPGDLVPTKHRWWSVYAVCITTRQNYVSGHSTEINFNRVCKQVSERLLLSASSLRHFCSCSTTRRPNKVTSVELQGTRNSSEELAGPSIFGLQILHTHPSSRADLWAGIFSNLSQSSPFIVLLIQPIKYTPQTSFAANEDDQ